MKILCDYKNKKIYFTAPEAEDEIMYMFEDHELFNDVLKTTQDDFIINLQKYHGTRCFGNNSELKFKTIRDLKNFLNNYLRPLVLAAVLITNRKIIFEKVTITDESEEM